MTPMSRAHPSPLRGGPTRGEAPSGVGVVGMERVAGEAIEPYQPQGSKPDALLGSLALRLIRQRPAITGSPMPATPTPLGLSAESALPARGREERGPFRKTRPG
jgi:hypothetical protein